MCTLWVYRVYIGSVYIVYTIYTLYTLCTQRIHCTLHTYDCVEQYCVLEHLSLNIIRKTQYTLYTLCTLYTMYIVHYLVGSTPIKTNDRPVPLIAFLYNAF